MAGWKKSEKEAVRSGKDEVRSGPRILKVEGGSDDKFKSTIVRILPPRDDAPKARWYIWVNAHFNVGPANRAVRCPRDFEEPCPVCAEVQALRRDGLEKEADGMRQQIYGLVNVVKLDKDGTPDGGVQVWRVNPKWLLQLINELEEEYPDENIDDPDEGRVITIRRSGSGIGKDQTTYAFRIAGKQTKFNGGDFTLLESMYDLETDVFPIFEAQKLLAFVTNPALPSGHDPFDDDDDDVVDGEFEEVEEKPKKKTKTQAAKPEVKEKTKKTKTSASSAQATARERLKAKLAAAADDEDDDDDDDEDDDDNDDDED